MKLPSLNSKVRYLIRSDSSVIYEDIGNLTFEVSYLTEHMQISDCSKLWYISIFTEVELF